MMPLYVSMFCVFAMIGLFCFGGGYGILPFIQMEVINRGWMSPDEFINVIAVSESTPGPLGINLATYVGYKMGGVVGSVFSTLGIMLPAFILVLTVVRLLQTKKGDAAWKRMRKGITPVVVGLICFAAFSIARTVLVQLDGGIIHLDWFGILLAVAGFVGIHKLKLHPVILIGAAAVIGAFLFS